MVSVSPFEGFYKSLSFLYRCVGVSPSFRDSVGKRLKRHPVSGLYLLLVVLYWTGIATAFTRKGLKNGTISIISNYVQLLLNALAYTVTTVNPIWKFRDYIQIIRGFNEIDHQLMTISVQMGKKKRDRLFYILTLAILTILIYNASFDFFVAVIQYETFLPYWILCATPIMVYALSWHQAILFIFAIHKRLDVARKLMQPTGSGLSTQSRDTALVHFLRVSSCGLPTRNNNNSLCYGNGLAKEYTTRVFGIINEIYFLSKKVNDYFGPVILSATGALFAITSIQGFHALIMVSDLDEKKHGTVWNLISCMNLILVNYLLLIGLCCVSEMVAKDVDYMMDIVFKKQQDEAVGYTIIMWSIIFEYYPIPLTVLGDRIQLVTSDAVQDPVLCPGLLQHQLQHVIWILDSPSHLSHHSCST